MFTEEIARGMAWLDTQDAAALPAGIPWFWRIDTSDAALNMSRGHDCVLGQSQPGGAGFDEIVDVFGWTWAAEHGFTLGIWRMPSPAEWESRDSMWRKLADEWRAAIRNRRVQVSV